MVCKFTKKKGDFNVAYLIKTSKLNIGRYKVIYLIKTSKLMTWKMVNGVM